MTSPPSRPPLSRERILDAALRLADERGLDALSMRALAAELGARPMSLYRHVADKRDILDGLMVLMLGELAPVDPSGDWVVDTRGGALAFRGVARRHPRVFPLFANRAVTSYLVGRELTEASLSALEAAGFDAHTASQTLRTVIRYVIGFSLGEPAGAGAGVEADADVSDRLRAEGLPHLARLVDDARDADPEDLFVFGLDALLDGLSRRAPPGVL